MKKLPRAFYNRDTITVARELLGKHLVHILNGKKKIGKIIEVEAYVGPHDLACHAARGLTPRTAVMFGAPGHAYIYMIYGMYYCMNIVTEKKGHASAVLLRAIEPVFNIEGRTQGPGLLCKAMQINKTLNAHDMTRSKEFYITEGENIAAKEIVAKPRIGIHYAGDWRDKLLRFYVRENAYVSKK